ncbi:TetR/AcrR family transcriptional regulator [Sphingomonas sp. UYAg733]
MTKAQRTAMGANDDVQAAESARPFARTRKSEKKRHAIIRAATDIINAKSYALATMTEIAAALDLRDATLYYYFPNKQALAYACHCRSLQTFERLLHMADEHGGQGGEKLERFLSGMLEDAEIHGAQIYFGDYTYLEAEQCAVIATWLTRLTSQLEDFLKAGITDGSIMPCETQLVVQLLVGMLMWLAKWAPSVKGMTTTRLMMAISAFSLDGLRNVPTAT